jgi:RNA polymerase sigma factor (sigma-70 family)
MEDEKIIDLLFERSEQALWELDQKYGNLCRSLSYRIVNSRRDAEECVNDAFLGAWNAIPPAKPNPLLSYLLKIVRNLSLKCYWKKEAAKRNSIYTIALQEIEACIADRGTVEEELEARELARIIESFLDTLPAENRVIFIRRYWFSDSYDDIAKRVGLSEKNISVRLTRIRRKLKDYLIEREVDI